MVVQINQQLFLQQVTNMTIINTIFDPRLRDLYIIFTNTTNNIVYICQLISVEKLDSIIYQLPIII